MVPQGTKASNGKTCVRATERATEETVAAGVAYETSNRTTRAIRRVC